MSGATAKDKKGADGPGAKGLKEELESSAWLGLARGVKGL